METKKITQKEILYEFQKHFVLLENFNNSLGCVWGAVLLSIIFSLIALIMVVLKG